MAAGRLEVPMTIPTPLERPDIIIPDSGPLIHLAQADALALLHQVGRRVVIVDVVAIEVTQDPTKPGARLLQDWFDAGQLPGSNAPISIEETTIGALLRDARQANPAARIRDAGELAMVQWLADKVHETDHTAMVLYENGKVPRVIANQGIDADIDVVTTRAFLNLAEQSVPTRGAAEYWRRIVEATPTASEVQATTMHRRVRSF
jgi:hypothetical protein